MASVRRYIELIFTPSWADTVCDKIWVDLKTAKIVMRYDYADPANREPGGRSDSDILRQRGVDTKEMIEESDCVVTAEQVRRNLYE